MVVIVFAIAVAAFLAVAMSIACWIALSSGRSGRIDGVWAIATGAASLACVAFANGPVVRKAIVASFLLIWALRLGAYAWQRAGAGDDPRYAALKEQWGSSAPRRMFFFLQAQAIASWPLAAASYVAAGASRAAPDARDALGLAIFAAALVGETIADRQMASFKRQPGNRGRICDTGLWSWSRHPNYFFEWLGWVGFPIVAIGSDYPWGWIAILAPITIYGLLVYVSGVPPLEEHLKRSRPEAFAAYARRVSEFWPQPPRN